MQVSSVRKIGGSALRLLLFLALVFHRKSVCGARAEHQISRSNFNSNRTRSTAMSCQSRLHTQRGFCQTYSTCLAGKETVRNCGDGLFWNPHMNAIHGGVCDHISNLHQDTLLKYQNHPKCKLPIVANVTGNECSTIYTVVLRDGKATTKSCADGLHWSTQLKRCEFCDKILLENGSNCCSILRNDTVYSHHANSISYASGSAKVHGNATSAFLCVVSWEILLFLIAHHLTT